MRWRSTAKRKKRQRSVPGKSEYGDHIKIFKYVCAFCGDVIRIEFPREYRYKRIVENKDKRKTYYFCSWGCMRKVDNGGILNRWKEPVIEE